MASEIIILTLLRAQIALGVGALIVLALRPLIRPWIGACLTYRLWLLVPALGLASLFPTLSEFLRAWSNLAEGGTRGDAGWLHALTDHQVWRPAAPALLIAWLCGAALMVMIFLFRELRFRHLARVGLAGPALMGIAAPRLVTPNDYSERFTARERAYILQHERTHIAQGDPLFNLGMAVLRIVGWFNPLVHLAAAAARLDQELACDALVIQWRPGYRRAYGEALLKAHLSRADGALVCAFTPAARHPLEVRLRALKGGDIGLRRYITGLIGLFALALALILAEWALSPGQQGEIAQPNPIQMLSLTLHRR